VGIFVRQCAIGGDGLRVAVKDTVDIAGLPTLAGTRARADVQPATRNAEVVDRALAAGCHIIGKTTLHELAFGVTGINDWGGTPENPRWPDLVPGGSSSGSAAAVAAGLADFAIGTDTGGSIRIPAACCGVFGLKPTFGRVSRRGVLPAESSIDCVGPMAASAEMLVRAMEIIDPTLAPVDVREPRIGLVNVDASPQIIDSLGRALAKAALSLREVTLPGMASAFSAGIDIINTETWSAFGHLLPSGLLGSDISQRLERARTVTAAETAVAERVRVAFRAEVDALLDTCDVLMLPTLPDFPPSLKQARSDLSAVALTRLVRPFNLSGHPAATVPLSTAHHGPIGLQIVGRHGEDALVLGVASTMSFILQA
jgi:amidase